MDTKNMGIIRYESLHRKITRQETEFLQDHFDDSITMESIIIDGDIVKDLLEVAKGNREEFKEDYIIEGGSTIEEIIDLLEFLDGVCDRNEGSFDLMID